MDDRALFDRQIATLTAIGGVIAAAAPDSRLIDLGGVSATIVPAAPGRSMFNGVEYSNPTRVEAVYDELTDAFEASGVTAWTVWVPAAHRAVADFLASRGHVLDAAPTAMVALLGECTLEFSLLEGVDMTRDADFPTLARVMAPPFDYDPEEAAHALALTPAGVHNYIARLDDEPVASVMAYDHQGDCGIYFVATHERARGRGLASALMTAALLDARERGCETTSLQATKAGYPIYARLGYRDLGRIEMWERRATG